MSEQAAFDALPKAHRTVSNECGVSELFVGQAAEHGRDAAAVASKEGECFVAGTRRMLLGLPGVDGRRILRRSGAPRRERHTTGDRLDLLSDYEVACSNVVRHHTN